MKLLCWNGCTGLGLVNRLTELGLLDENVCVGLTPGLIPKALSNFLTLAGCSRKLRSIASTGSTMMGLSISTPNEPTLTDLLNF